MEGVWRAEVATGGEPGRTSRPIGLYGAESATVAAGGKRRGWGTDELASTGGDRQNRTRGRGRCAAEDDDPAADAYGRGVGERLRQVPATVTAPDGRVDSQDRSSGAPEASVPPTR